VGAFNNWVPIKLKAGKNELLVKLLRRGDEVKFTRLSVTIHGHPGKMNCEDWMIDLADRV
jgi:hypothetical protein